MKSDITKHHTMRSLGKTDISERMYNKKSWTALRWANYYFYKDAFSRCDPKGVLLDVGAGHSQFRDLTDTFSRTESLDFEAYERVTIVCDLQEGLPFEKLDTYDYIMMSNVLEHLPNPAQIISDSFKVLKGGGKLFITVPFMLMLHQEPYDYFRYSHYALKRLCESAGYSQVSVVPLGTSSDVIEQTLQHFFCDALEKNNVKKTKYLMGKIVWNFYKVLNRCTRRLYKNDPARLNYTLGYGVIAHKQS